MNTDYKLFKDKRVSHISFGEGIVKELVSRPESQTRLMVIDFSGKEKRFHYPDAFEKYLFSDDDELMDIVKKDLAEAKTSKIQNPNSFVNEKSSPLSENALRHQQSRNSSSASLRSPAIRTTSVTGRSSQKASANIAFKCNYNDGGKDAKRIGFHGVCSNSVIHNNVAIEKREWCSHERCPCCQYHSGLLTRKQLETVMSENWDNTCNEGQLLLNWKALAGTCNNGPRRGEHFKIRGARNNGLAVLTTRLPRQKEEYRRIFALFLIDKIDEGDEETSGSVRSTSRYRISFSEEESEQLLYWKYHANRNNPSKPAWGSGLFRYLSDEEAVQILRDAAIVKKGTSDEVLAKEFLDHYCLVNRIDISDVPAPCGALGR